MAHRVSEMMKKTQKADGKGDKPGWLRHSGMGTEFAAAVAGFAFVGYWIDRHYGSQPWGVLVGAALGLTGGTYNLVRSSMKAFAQIEQDKQDSESDDNDDSSNLKK